MAPKTAPYKRESIPVNKLEVEMMEYQLREARGTIEKQSTELDRVAGLLERTTKVADQRIEKVNALTQLTVKLSKQVSYWKLIAIMEGVAIITYLLLQGV